jgi:hypothetical protein
LNFLAAFAAVLLLSSSTPFLRPKQRKLDDDSNTPFFSSGEFTKNGDGFEVTLKLYTTQSGKIIKEQTKSGPDLMKVIDVLDCINATLCKWHTTGKVRTCNGSHHAAH